MLNYDVVVIGAGIHGAGVAQAASANGYSVLVLEQTAMAAGTSSRSSKLIHGGLRYLETAQFSLVRECLRERQILLKIAPHLVKLSRFYIPVYKRTKRSSLQIRLGLSLYATLGGFNASSNFQTFPRHQWHELDGLSTHNLRSVFRYWDAQTDDVALTRAVMRSAEERGAQLIEEAKFIRAEITRDHSVIHYVHNNNTTEVCAKVLVNAAGPWVNEVLAQVTPHVEMLEIALVQGSHFVVDKSLSKGIYYLESPDDQRAIFLMPWRGKALLGTTETEYNGTPDNVKPLHQEQNYLLKTFGYYFPEYANRQVEILDSFAGLRVLPKTSDSPFRRSRETQLLVDDKHKPRLLSIYGGKLTSYRATALKVLATIQNALPGKSQRLADTADINLPEFN